jgi:hypothetical protein
MDRSIFKLGWGGNQGISSSLSSSYHIKGSRGKNVFIFHCEDQQREIGFFPLFIIRSRLPKKRGFGRRGKGLDGIGILGWVGFWLVYLGQLLFFLLGETTSFVLDSDLDFLRFARDWDRNGFLILYCLYICRRVFWQVRVREMVVDMRMGGEMCGLNCIKSRRVWCA